MTGNTLDMPEVIVNGKKFTVMDVYYSVGPLQVGCLEEWTFTGDIYDYG